MGEFFLFGQFDKVQMRNDKITHTISNIFQASPFAYTETEGVCVYVREKRERLHSTNFLKIVSYFLVESLPFNFTCIIKSNLPKEMEIKVNVIEFNIRERNRSC